MRIVFFGSGEFGLPTLRRLATTHQIVGVVSQPDRPAGRGGSLTPTPIAAFAAEHLPDVPLFKPEKVAEPELTARLRALVAGGGAFVVIAFGQKMPAALLDGIFAVNLHASLLPRWRGAAPINAAILAGDAQTGNSVITLAERMDAGLVLAQSRRPVDPEQTAGELHDLLSADGPELVERVLAEHQEGAASSTTQDESLVTKAPKLSRKDALLDLSLLTAEEARRRVHGLTPWPGVSVVLAGEPIKLLRVRVEAVESDAAVVERVRLTDPPDSAPGSLVDVAGGVVECARGTRLRLVQVQPAGKRPMGWEDFARGRTLVAGARLLPPS